MKNETKAASTDKVSTLLLIQIICNSVFISYLSRIPKIGGYHIIIGTVLSILISLLSLFVVIRCIQILKSNKERRFFPAAVLGLALLAAVFMIPSALSYCKDLAGGNKTVTTERYLVSGDTLYFLDDGQKVSLILPKETAEALRTAKSSEYDSENNLLVYAEPVTVTYSPNNKIIVSVSAAGDARIP